MWRDIFSSYVVNIMEVHVTQTTNQPELSL